MISNLRLLLGAIILTNKALWASFAAWWFSSKKLQRKISPKELVLSLSQLSV